MTALRSFVGGMNVPVAGGFGRFNATIPLARLDVDADGVTFFPRFFARPFVRPYRIARRDVAVAYPVSGRLFASGVGFETGDGSVAYFWTPSQHFHVLNAVAAFGVPVDPQPRSPRFWRLGSGGSRRGAEVPRLVRVGSVVGFAGSVPMLVFLETRPGPAFWHVWIGVVWLAGVGLWILTWLARRRA